MRTQARPAFTLIELLVVMVIIIILATLSYFMLPGMLNRQKASSGPDLVQRWLLIAKQRALRDRAPRGVRFLVDPNNGNLITSCQYIEQPLDYTGGTLKLQNNGTTAILQLTSINNPAATITFWPQYVTGSGVPAPDTMPAIEGDYIYIPSKETGPWHLITSINSPGSGQPVTITILNNPAGNIWAQLVAANSTLRTVGITDFVIARSARPLQGEEPLQLPQDVVIDPSGMTAQPPSYSGTSGPTGLPLSGTAPNPQYFDVLFSPAGNVLNAGAGGKFVFYVHDIPADGTSNYLDQTLVVVYTHTGLIAAHPVDLTSGDPWSYVKDGRSSGM